MSLASEANWGSNLIIDFTFLTLIQLLGSWGTLWLYVIVGILALIFCYKLVPGTKGHTLEEMERHWRADKTSCKMGKRWSKIFSKWVSFFTTHQKRVLFLSRSWSAINCQQQEQSLEMAKSQQHVCCPTWELQRTLTTRLPLFITPFHYVRGVETDVRLNCVRIPLSLPWLIE